MKKFNEKNDQNIFKAINKLGIEETKELLSNFLNGGGLILDMDKGLILSAFTGYYDINSQVYDDEHIITGFINYAMYKGLKHRI